MQTVIAPPTTLQTAIDQPSARQIADTYLVETVGQYFSVNHGVFARSVWRFLIQWQMPKMSRVAIVGRLDVNAQSSVPVFLSSSDIETIQERCMLFMADLDGMVSVDAKGYVSPYLAKRKSLSGPPHQYFCTTGG